MGKDVKYSITFTAIGDEDGLVDGGEASIVLDVPENATHVDTLCVVANGLAVLLAAECISDAASIEEQLTRANEVCRIVSDDLQEKLFIILTSQGMQGVVRA